MPVTDSSPLKLSEKHATRLKNVTCCYCGKALNSRETTDDHVIGRKFVPSGALLNRWNLVVRACVACNSRKSDLEDDISSITMAHHLHGFSCMSNPEVQSEARRKIHRSTSRKTRKKVRDSSENITFSSAPSPSLKINGNFFAPPQIEQERSNKLAMLQIMAFFYLLTFEQDKKIGHYWPGDFYVTQSGIKTDWGNARFLYFMQLTSSWDYRLIANTANGFFKVSIRKSPDSACWSWAIEWNDCYRLIGFFGENSYIEDLLNDFPLLDKNLVSSHPSSKIFFREEVEIIPESDSLFDHSAGI